MTDDLQIQGHIQRLEAAEEVEQGALILDALTYAYASRWITTGQFHLAQEQLRREAYLDAARTLVPEGWHGEVRFGKWPEHDPRHVALWSNDLSVKESVYGVGLTNRSATPALGLTIAALKARKAVG